MKYSEHPDPEKLLSQAKKLRSLGHKISFVSNDPMQHTFCNKLPETGFGSFSVKFLRKFGLPSAKYVRLGIEGVSERLRSYVNKPISHDDLVKCTSWLNKNGKAVRWFMIAGLPTETDEDWRELKQAVQDWKKITPKGAMGIGFTAFCPCPATPFATFPLDDTYYDRFLDFWNWFFEGEGFTNRLYISKPQKPKARLSMAKDSMCMSAEELYSGGSWGGNDFVEYPYKKQVKKIAERLKKNE